MCDYLQEAVDRFKISDELYSQLFRTIIVHYLLGKRDYPYTLRRTNVIINQPSQLANRSQEDHKRVMQEYIRYLDRNNTFLDLTINTFIAANYPILFQGEVKIQKNREAPYFSYDENPSGNTDKSTITWSINQAAVNILIPNNEVQEFLDKIYEREKLEDKWNKFFALCRAELFGRISKPNSSFEEKEKIWNKLASIQAILMYFIYTSVIPTDQENTSPSCSVLIQQNENNSSDNYSELAVAIFCPSIEESVQGSSYITINDVEKSIIGKLKDILYNVNQARKFANNSSETEIYKCLNLDKSITKEFQKEIRRNIYRVNFRIPTFVTDWVILLTSFLLSQKHEGKLLNFFLVCGELSEFEDFKDTIFRRVEGLEEMGPPDELEDINNIKKLAENRARQIAKEHYPWFENGRYALFWNTASQEKYPIGLVSIELSSWEKLIQDRFRDNLSLTIPNCLVGYVYGDPQTVGILEVCEENQNTEDREDREDREVKVAKELLRWKNNQWKSVMNEERWKKLKNLLYNEFQIPESDRNSSLENIVKIALRIADEPDKGGTIVFIDGNDDLNQFKSMGTPWIPIGNLTTDDVIALIAQDGAVLCPLVINENDQSFNIKSWQDWHYRKLLTPNSEVKAFFDETQMYYERTQGNWPLNSKGSRRWSAAMAAFHQSIKTVLVISQDGDMHVWNVDNDRRRVRMTEILIQEEGNEFDQVIPTDF